MPSRTRARSFVGLFAAGLWVSSLLQACGGRSDTEEWLYADLRSGASSGARAGDTGRGAAGGGPSASAGSGTGVGASGGTGVVGVAGASSMGGTPAGGGGPIGQAGTAIGAQGGMAQGGSAQGGNAQGGVGGEPSGPRTTCGESSCDASAQQCCAGLGGFECMDKGSDCNGAVLSCGNSDDCPGAAACCLRVIEAEVGSSSQCKAACVAMGPSRERQLCRSDEECPSGHCRPTVFGVSVCTRF